MTREPSPAGPAPARTRESAVEDGPHERRSLIGARTVPVLKAGDRAMEGCHERAGCEGREGLGTRSDMKRLVVVADNPLIVGAIRLGLRDSGTFELLGYADPCKATAASIVQAGAEVVLVDQADSSDVAIALIRGLLRSSMMTSR